MSDNKTCPDCGSSLMVFRGEVVCSHFSDECRRLTIARLRARVAEVERERDEARRQAEDFNADRVVRVKAALAERDEARAQLAAFVSPEWKPTSSAINALPYPLRRYIHDLETNADPAGMVRENVLVRDENRMLRAHFAAVQEREGRMREAVESAKRLAKKHVDAHEKIFYIVDEADIAPLLAALTPPAGNGAADSEPHRRHQIPHPRPRVPQVRGRARARGHDRR